MKWLQPFSARLTRFLLARFPALKSQSVRTALNATGKGGKKAEERYYTAKISRVLAVLIAGGVLIFLVWMSSRNDSILNEDGTLQRNAHGGYTQRLGLTAQSADGTLVGTYDVAIEAVRYTEEECMALFEEISEKLPEMILGENESTDRVSAPLDLMTSLPGCPFRIAWSSSQYFRLRTDGTPVTEDVPDEGEEVLLTATFSYGDLTLEKEIPVRVIRPFLSPEEIFRAQVREAIDEADDKTRFTQEVRLPTEVLGQSLHWSEVKSTPLPALVVLVLICAVLVFFAEDKVLQGEMKRREEALMCAYPGFVSRLALYLGAGMTVRGIFGKLAADYDRALQKGGERNPLMDEIKTASAELANGVSEIRVYEHFAQRIGLSTYTRLCSLLTQNLVKGSAHLLTLMRAESAQATRERMDRARVRGEQAGTKLMLPMMLMLGVVMVLVMVPAYMSI